MGNGFSPVTKIFLRRGLGVVSIYITTVNSGCDESELRLFLAASLYSEGSPGLVKLGSTRVRTVQHSLDQLNSKIFLSSILRLGDVLKVPETNCDHELFNRVVSMATLKTYFYTALSSDEHYGWQYIFLVCIITSNTTLGLRLLNAKKQIFIFLAF